MSIHIWSILVWVVRSSPSCRWRDFLPTSAGHRAVLRQHAHSLADQHLGVPAADRAEPGESVVVDMRDD